MDRFLIIGSVPVHRFAKIKYTLTLKHSPVAPAVPHIRALPSPRGVGYVLWENWYEGELGGGHRCVRSVDPEELEAALPRMAPGIYGCHEDADEGRLRPPAKYSQNT